MNNLDYAKPTVETPPNWWMRRRLIIATLSFLVAAIAFVLYASHRHRPVPPLPATTYTIQLDSDAPTDVYMGSMFIGQTPLQLSIERRRELGLPEFPPTGRDAIESDEWGERIFLPGPDGAEHALMFKVADPAAARNLSIETPWGRRTKFYGSAYARLAKHWMSSPFPADLHAIEIHISVPATIGRKSDAAVPVTFTAWNICDEAIVGESAQLELFWGTDSTPPDKRSTKICPLPAKWASFGVGEKLTTTVNIATPDVAGNYYLFPVMGIVKGGKLLDNSNIDGDTVLVRVK